jgi:hypothetical protein
MIYLVTGTDTFPRQQARTRRFTLGVPRSFQISPDALLLQLDFLRRALGVPALGVPAAGSGP